MSLAQAEAKAGFDLTRLAAPLIRPEMAKKTSKKTNAKASKQSPAAGKAGAKGTAAGAQKKTPAKAAPARTPARPTAKKKSPGQNATSTLAGRSRSAQPRAVFDEDRIIPAGFLWGAATSATQIGGGDTASDWFDFCTREGRIADGSSPAVACDHWNRFEEDFRTMRDLGFNAYRLGADWSRFEPEPGQWNFAALDHFREMIGSLNKKRIRPLLTLNHFTLPRWWLARGGWTKEENLRDFYKYVEFLVAGCGDLVNEYITINEPNVYALLSYLEGIWPPGGRGLLNVVRFQQVQRNMLLAHFGAYDLIRKLHASKNFAAPLISVAQHYQLMDPLRPGNRLDEDRTASANLRFNEVWTDGVASGTLPRPLGKGEKVHDGQAWDFYGLNYYSRRLVSFAPFAPQQLFIRSEIKKDAPLNDLGWEIYPEGFTRVLMHLHQKYGLPIRVTENGIAADNDEDRAAFLTSHIEAMKTAMRRGVPVDGYYHWSLLDNFEWAEGYTARFGLVGVDFETQQRTVRPSASLYASMIRASRR